MDLYKTKCFVLKKTFCNNFNFQIFVFISNDVSVLCKSGFGGFIRPQCPICRQSYI